MAHADCLQIVGRLAPQIARLLMGKHKPTLWAGADCGDWVVVKNAKYAVFTGTKLKSKLYQWHTGWMGGLKALTARQLQERAPDRVIEAAVKGMMPPNRLRPDRLRRLRIFAEETHEHESQTAASSAYAAEHLALTSPRKFEPKPKKATGNLVSDYFAGRKGDDAKVTELSKELTVEDPAEALAKLEVELARRSKLADADAAKQLR